MNVLVLSRVRCNGWIALGECVAVCLSLALAIPECVGFAIEQRQPESVAQRQCVTVGVRQPLTESQRQHLAFRVGQSVCQPERLTKPVQFGQSVALAECVRQSLGVRLAVGVAERKSKSFCLGVTERLAQCEYVAIEQRLAVRGIVAERQRVTVGVHQSECLCLAECQSICVDQSVQQCVTLGQPVGQRLPVLEQFTVPESVGQRIAIRLGQSKQFGQREPIAERESQPVLKQFRLAKPESGRDDQRRWVMGLRASAVSAAPGEGRLAQSEPEPVAEPECVTERLAVGQSIRESERLAEPVTESESKSRAAE